MKSPTGTARTVAALLCALAVLCPLQSGRAQTPFLRVEAGGHTARVSRAVWVPSSSGGIISCGGDRAIRLWNVEAQRQTGTLQVFRGAGMRGVFDSMAISPDGKRLACVGFEGQGRDARVRVFDLASGAIVQVLTHPNNGVSDVQFSPDGTRLAACSDRAHPAWMWDVATGKTLWSAKAFKEAANRIAFAPNGNWLAVASDDTRAHLLATSDGQETATLAHDAPVRSVAFSPDGKTLATGADDGIIRLWPLAGGKASGDARRLPPQGNPILCLCFAGDRLVSGQGERVADFGVRVWDVAAGTLRGQFTAHKNSVLTVAASPDGSRIASGDYDGNLYVWPVNAPTAPVASFVSRGRHTQSIAWSKTGRQVALTDETGQTRAFDFANAAPALAPPAPLTSDWLPAQTTRNGLSLSLADDSLSVRVMQGTSSKLTLRLSDDRAPLALPGGVTTARRQDMDRDNRIRAAVFLPDGRVAVGSDFSLALFGPDGKLQTELLGHTAQITALAASPDGAFLASASADQTVRVWAVGAQGTPPALAPLLSLYEEDRGEWVLWTEAGYFAASPGGDALIGWHLNRGEDDAAQFYTAEQFWHIFYRPDVLVRTLETGSIDRAVALADQSRTDGGKTDPGKTPDNLTRFAPPSVAILEPADGTTVTDDALTVKVQVSDPNGRKITRLWVRANGTGERGIGVEAAPGASETVTRTARLQPGVNVVLVVAQNDADAQSAPRQIRVTYRPPVPRRPNLFLLSVGVSKYPPSPVFQSLNFADADARDFAEGYARQEGQLFDKVVYRHVVLNENARRDALVRELSDLAAQKVQTGDYVIVFLAGHGAPIAPEAGNRDFCFLTQDAVAGRFAQTALGGVTLLDAMQAFPCNVLVVLDTCRAGSDVLRADDPNVKLAYLSGKIDYGRVTIQSCGPTEKSLESADWQHGAFTKAFLEGIGGAARRTGPDGSISLLDMEAYLASEVRRLTGGKQNPRVLVPSYIGLVKAAFPMAQVK